MVASASFRDAIHGLNGGPSSPRPACGERSRASCERVRGTLDRLALADSPPHPETLLRAVSDLSPQAGEVLMLVIASGAKQSMARHRQIEDGLLRSARNDGVDGPQRHQCARLVMLILPDKGAVHERD